MRLSELVGLAASCILPPIINKDTHLPFAQDERVEMLLMVMITVYRGGRGTPGGTECEVKSQGGGLLRTRRTTG